MPFFALYGDVGMERVVFTRLSLRESAVFDGLSAGPSLFIITAPVASFHKHHSHTEWKNFIPSLLITVGQAVWVNLIYFNSL